MQSPTRNFIDGAGLLQVVQCLELPSEKLFPWSVQAAVNSTVLLLGSNNSHLPPPVTGRRGFFPSELDFLKQRLLSAGVIQPLPPTTDEVRKSVTAATKRWGTQNATSHQQRIRELFGDNENFVRWFEWCVQNMWLSPQVANGVLFDPAFSKQLSLVTDVSEAEMLTFYQDTSRPERVADIVKNRNGALNAEFELLANLFIASYLYRGKFYDLIAKRSEWQISQHALRESFCTDTLRHDVIFPVSNTLECLSRIIVAGAAHSSRHLHDRVACWADNIAKVRPIIASGIYRLDSTETQGAAVDTAVSIVKSANIETGNSAIAKRVEWGTSIGLGVLTGVTLDWFVGVPVAFAAERVLGYFSAASGIGKLVQQSQTQLKDIGSGRVGFKWQAAKTNKVVNPSGGLGGS